MKELIHHYGAWIVFALVFLESIGLPFEASVALRAPDQALFHPVKYLTGLAQHFGEKPQIGE